MPSCRLMGFCLGKNVSTGCRRSASRFMAIVKRTSRLANFSPDCKASTASSRRPLGVAVVGGLAFSQIVTLYVTPVFYTYLDELQDWLGRVFAKLPWAERPVMAPVPASGD